ncbi:acyltransferase family protein [Rhodococcus sp. NPDC054953]
MPVRTTAPVTTTALPTPATRSTHRADLDGLRGLAIALVVVFHVWFGRVSGGVDVFLALAGFFFIGSLVRGAESAGSLDPRPVLLRTARRLLAPLVLVLAATTVAATLLIAPTAWLALAEQGRAALLFWENWHLAETASDYLAADPSVSPLQHLWSIAVQGQFYLLALAVVFTLAWLLRMRRIAVRGPVIALLAVATAVSFAYATFGERPQTWMYYDTGARLWELLAGGLLACIAPYLRVPRVIRALLGVAGVAAIVATGMVLDGRNDFPGPWALVPVGATIAVIVAGAATLDTPAARLLASPPLQRLGDIAYSLYLWHWPVLIFTLIAMDRPTIGLRGGLLVIGISLVLAELTTRLVEEPIRRGAPSLRRRALVGGVSLLGLAVVATTTTWIGIVASESDQLHRIAALDADRYPGAAAIIGGVEAPPRVEQPSRYVAHLDLPVTTADGCLPGGGELEAVHCVYGNPAATRTIAVIGGSHSEHWFPALEIIARDRGLRLETYMKVGCPVMLAAPGAEPEECEAWSEGVVDALAAAPPDLVFSTATRPLPAYEPGEHTPDGYVRLWTRLSELGIPMALIRDTPWLSENSVNYRAADCLAAGGTSVSCGIDRARVFSEVDPSLAATADLPLAHTLDLSDWVCRTDRCRVVEGNILVYRDSNHLTTAYARTLAPELDRQLGRASGWW